MKNLSSWLLVMFMGMFWLFRIVVAFQAQYDQNFGGFIAFNFTFEVVLLFVAILCMILVLRRNIFGGILYLASYGFYFGGYILTNAIPVLMSGETMDMSVMQNTLVSAVALIIAFCVFFDLLVNKIRKRDPKDKKTDWFFNNEQYDRKYDERADKNQYRNY
jgi:hypothetical protein